MKDARTLWQRSGPLFLLGFPPIGIGFIAFSRVIQNPGMAPKKPLFRVFFQVLGPLGVFVPMLVITGVFWTIAGVQASRYFRERRG